MGEAHISGQTWASSAAVTRHTANPILTKDQVPYPATLVYNCGVTRYQGRYVMVFRDDYNFIPTKIWHKFEGIVLGLAFSDDGIHWSVQPQPILEDLKNEENLWAYDPRLTVIDGRCYMTFCLDTRHGMRAGIAVTKDFQKFEVISLSVPDLRNVVLFPEKVGGRYLRLERPFPIYLRRNWAQVDRFDLWMSASFDLQYWGDTHLQLAVEQVPFANEKIGPGSPPIKTRHGWLELFHAVETGPSINRSGWEGTWNKNYYAGVMLLDLENPRKILGMCRRPLLSPEAPYEISGGFRNGVIFPTAIVPEPDGQLKIYYGASDTVICLATAHVDDLTHMCLEDGPP